MRSCRTSRLVLAAVIGAAGFCLPHAAMARIVVGPDGVSVEGPESSDADAPGPVVVAHPKGRTNLRKSAAFVSVGGAEAGDQRKTGPA